MSYEDNAIRIERTRYFLPAIEIKYYNVINDGKNALIIHFKKHKMIAIDLGKQQALDLTQRQHSKLILLKI